MTKQAPHKPPPPPTAKPRSVADALQDFMRLESAGGILLLLAAALAMLAANSPLAFLHQGLLDTPVAVSVGALAIDKPLLLWINDGLMAIFFFLIGLEIKREFMQGELSSAAQVALPAAGALGGMLAPAAIYAWLNWHDAAAMDGWGIPVATDIAFALALLVVFGRRVPLALKVFLMTLAIFDDLAAIAIIALFYSADLSLSALIAGGTILAAMVLMNRLGVTRTSAYILMGVALWVAVLKSGVHATLAGVLAALCIPFWGGDARSPVRELEQDLHGPVAFVILPLFAFANAGLALSGMSFAALAHPVTLGIILGLLIGKPLGIMLCTWLACALRLASLPPGIRWAQILGASCACGIGFTMSLFIASLAFEHNAASNFGGDRLGILVGSLLSALVAAALLHLSLPRARA